MDVLESIIKRRSIRKFNDIPIPKDVIADLLIAGQNAPCAGNFQNCRVFILDDETVKDNVSDACYRQSWMKFAPVFAVVVAEMNDIEKMYGERGKNLYAIENASVIAQNMILTATSHGLGTCWVSAFNEEKVSQALDLPETYRPIVVIPIGYPDEVVPAPPKIELRGFTYVNTFGGSGRVTEKDFLFKDYAHFIETHVRKGAKSTRSTFKKVSEIIYNKAKPHVDNLKRANKHRKDSKTPPPVSEKKK